jgi:hypothetical protein
MPTARCGGDLQPMVRLDSPTSSYYGSLSSEFSPHALTLHLCQLFPQDNQVYGILLIASTRRIVTFLTKISDHNYGKVQTKVTMAFDWIIAGVPRFESNKEGPPN